MTALFGAGPAMSAAPAKAAVPAHAPTFDLEELRVEGNTILTEREIDDTVYPFLGPGKTADDVERARAALEKLYSDRGYPTVSTTVPVQSAREGVVVLTVTERKVGRLRVVGAQYVAPRVIRDAAPSVQEGKVPNFNALQADVVAMNQYADRSVTPTLKAGREPDTVDVDLKVADTPPWHGSLEVNNQQSQETTPLRLNGTISYDNLWQRGDAVSVSYDLAPERPADYSVFNASYLFHVPSSDVSLSANFIHSNSNVTTLGSTNVLGKGDILQLRALVPLGTMDDFTHSLSAGFDYKHVSEIVGLSGQSSSTPITYYPFSVAYSAGWAEPNSSTDVVGTLVWAFRGLGNNYAFFDAKRTYALPNFVYLKADASRTQELPYNLEAYAHATAEISPSPLVSNEQLSIGGIDTVRGYYESEALGDMGAAGQFELRSPPLSRYVGSPLNDLRLHIFGDAGATEIRQPLAGQSASATLASVGVGARFRVYDHLSGTVEDAIPLHDGPATHAGWNHVLFRLIGDF